ncbi:MAG: hypothetical protein ACM3TT_09735 [Syntrophothermus sp.]
MQRAISQQTSVGIVSTILENRHGPQSWLMTLQTILVPGGAKMVARLVMQRSSVVNVKVVPFVNVRVMSSLKQTSKTALTKPNLPGTGVLDTSVQLVVAIVHVGGTFRSIVTNFVMVASVGGLSGETGPLRISKHSVVVLVWTQKSYTFFVSTQTISVAGGHPVGGHGPGAIGGTCCRTAAKGAWSPFFDIGHPPF